MQRLTSQFILDTLDACHKAFWTKDALRIFLRSHKISEKHLASWNYNTESKKQYLTRLFYDLVNSRNNYGATIYSIACSLSEMSHYSDLDNWDNSKELKEKARDAIAKLSVEVNKIKVNKEELKRQEQRRKEAEAQRLSVIASQTSIATLDQRLKELTEKLGTREGGYGFEKWLYDLALFFDIDAKPSYKIGNQQIDAAFTIDGTTFLVETKFKQKPIQSPEIRDFLGKVTQKADNTMGIMVSMSGYTPDAINNASGDRTPLLLLDYDHIMNLVLGKIIPLQDVIRRVKRNASQTGRAYLSRSDFD